MGIFDNYKEQSAEMKRLKKERKLLRKREIPIETRRTKTLTMIAFSLLMLFAFTISPILSLLNNLDNSNFDLIDNLAKDYIDELTEPVNVENLIKYGRIPESASESLYTTLKTYGIDIFNSDHSINADKVNTFTKVLVNPISLSGHEVGAFVNGLINATDEDIVIDNTSTELTIKAVKVIELSIYTENESTYIYSILSIPLNELLDEKDLPHVYVCTNSKISIENNDIKISESTTKINEIDTTTNSNIISILDAILHTAGLTIHSLNTDIIWSILKNFSTNLHANLVLDETNIVLTPKTY